MPDFKEFINPESSLTPGIAGALTTSLALPLIWNFKYLKFPWVAIALSFLLSLVIIGGFKEVISLGKRCLYCLLNTLIIFAVATGAFSKIETPPVPEPISPHFFSLACGILDKTAMNEDNKEFIKALLEAHSAQPTHVSWLDLLMLSPALAQPGGGQPASPAVAPGAGRLPTATSESPPSPPTSPPAPQVSAKDLEAAKQYQLRQQKIKQDQKRFDYQSTF